MSEFKHRTIALYKNYFSDFYKMQGQKVKDKILWTLRIIESQKHIPTDYLKHIEGTDELYEIRIQQANDIFRIFCFFEKGEIIILINDFQKKTQKTPKSEIERALIIKQNYEQEK